MSGKSKASFYASFTKGFFDIICAFAEIVVFCWLDAIVAIPVRIKLGSPESSKLVYDDSPQRRYLPIGDSD
jgi:lipopolysaccharide/colanic/teichoic acid biosynthesis glycosyltransferase